MARVYDNVKYLKLPVASGKVKDDPVLCGTAITGFAKTDRDSDGYANVQIRGGVYTCSVKGINGSGDSAVVLGDALYYVAADTPNVSKKATGFLIGYALAGVDAGATATIQVLQPA